MDTTRWVHWTLSPRYTGTVLGLQVLLVSRSWPMASRVSYASQRHRYGNSPRNRDCNILPENIRLDVLRVMATTPFQSNRLLIERIYRTASQAPRKRQQAKRAARHRAAR